MDISYFQKINNTYKSKSRQESDLYLLNRHIDDYFTDTIDYHIVKRNGKPFELLIIKDTDNNTFKKKIKSKHSEPFNLGDYIEWNNQIWIITLLNTDDKTYHSGYMYLCTVPLHWQNSEGKIIERFGYAEDFTKYSSGTTGNSVMTIGDNQYGLTIPIDDETKKLNRDMRFCIDFDDSDKPDIYKLTNRKTHLNNNTYFGRGGIITLTLSFDAFNPNDDRKVTLEDGREVWICNYNNSHIPTPPTPPLPDETTDLSAVIFGDSELQIGFSNTYAVTFADKKTGSSVDWNMVNFTWNIVSNFDIDQTENNNEIDLYVEDEDLADEKFKLQVIVNDVILAEKIISISGIM